MDTMIRESGELDIGILVDGVVHRAFSLRPATLADSYQAMAAVNAPANMAEDTAAKVAYQVAVDDAQILLQLVMLGGLTPIPSPQALASEMDPDDMEILRIAADSVKKKLRESRKSLPLSGEPNSSSSAPASA